MAKIILFYEIWIYKLEKWSLRPWWVLRDHLPRVPSTATKNTKATITKFLMLMLRAIAQAQEGVVGNDLNTFENWYNWLCKLYGDRRNNIVGMHYSFSYGVYL